MTAKEARGLVAKHGSKAAAARAAGMAASTFCDRLAGKPQAKAGAHGVTGGVRANVMAKSLSEFRATFDKSFIIPQRVRDGLKKLGAGWEMESQFAKLAGISLMDLGNVRDEFADYWVALSGENRGRRAWFGSKATAKAAKEMIG